MGRRPEPKELIAAAVGFGAIFLLVMGTSAFSYMAGNQAQAEARELVTESGKTAYLVGRTGRDLSRIHADTLEALTEAPASVGPIAERITRVNADLDHVIAELEPRLSDAQITEWQRVTPTISTLRGDFKAALADIQQGRAVVAENVLDRDAVLSAWLFDQLESMSEISRIEARRAIDEMDARIAAAGRLQTLAFAVLLLCTLFVSIVVVRELRRQRLQLSSYVDRIETSNQDLEAFAGRIAHDLKNLLTPVMVAPRLLERAGGDATAVGRISGRLERSSRRAIDLLEGLLAFAKAGAPSEHGTASVATELQQVLEELSSLAEQMRVSIEIEVQPAATAACTPALLHIVLLNLLSNAIKFLEGRERRWVGVKAHVQQGACVLEIADSGPGIPRALRTRVFEPFFRGPGNTVPGTGIGLATVQRIVTAHGGTITLESLEGEGTRVRVQLPLPAAVASTSSMPVTEPPELRH